MPTGILNGTSMINLSIVPEAMRDNMLLGTTWLVPLVILGLSTVAITRDPKVMKRVLFPLAIGWHLALAPFGMGQNLMVLIITGLVFVSDIFTLEILGTTIGWANDRIRFVGERVENAFRESSRRKKVYSQLSSAMAIGGKERRQIDLLYKQRRLADTPEKKQIIDDRIKEIQGRQDLKIKRATTAKALGLNYDELAIMDRKRAKEIFKQQEKERKQAEKLAEKQAKTIEVDSYVRPVEIPSQMSGEMAFNLWYNEPKNRGMTEEMARALWKSKPKYKGRLAKARELM